MDHDDDLSRLDPESTGGRVVVDAIHHLDLEEVVARAETAELVEPALDCVLADILDVVDGERTLVFTALEVVARAIAGVDREPRSAAQHLTDRRRIELEQTAGPCAGRNAPGQPRHQAVEQWLHLVERETGAEQANPAGDVEANATRGDDAIPVDIGCRDAADGKAVAPVDVGHGVAGLHDAWQGGDVLNLAQRPIAHRRGQ